MTTTKQERVERLLDELIDNNSDALYIMTHYAEAVEATFKTIKGLME